MKKSIVSLFPFLFSASVYAQTFTTNDVYKAWEEENLGKLITIHSKSPSLRGLTEEAIGQMNIKNLSLSFEELQSYTEQLEVGSPLYNLLINSMKDRKSQVLQEVSSYTPEELEAYMVQHPEQSTFIQQEMHFAVCKSLTSLPLNELYYVDRVMPFLDHQQIAEETKGRNAERRDILMGNLSDYMKKEKAELGYMEYVLRMKEHEYFRNKFRASCIEYARVKEVSPNVYAMASQYERVLNRHLNPKSIQQYLQKEADALCSAINASRSEYCRAMGKNDFVKLSIAVPAPSYDCYIYTAALDKVIKAYEDYNSSREAISIGGNIARFFGAGIWASIGEGIAEYAAGSSLADNVTDAQLEYVGDSYRILENQVKQQIDNAHKSILKQITDNQQKFIKDVNK
ncbi:MAG: hypothetical protein J1F40_04525 [Prevotellaceae bacterium]|nr:hypothetical protein [Prevotellaceae bacterium]